MVAFSGFYESHKPLPSDDAHGIVTPHRDGHQNGQKKWVHFASLFVDCRPGGHQGDTEQVVTRWRRPVASSETLVMLHRTMCSVLLQCIWVAIEMTCDGGAFIRPRCLFCLA